MTTQLKHILCMIVCVSGLMLHATPGHAQSSSEELADLFLTTTIVALVMVAVPVSSMVAISTLGAGGAVALTKKKPTEKESRVLNEYIERNETQLPMDITIGAGPAIDELIMLVGYQTSPGLLRAHMRRNRRAILDVAKMPHGQARGRALYHVLRTIKPMPSAQNLTGVSAR